MDEFLRQRIAEVTIFASAVVLLPLLWLVFRWVERNDNRIRRPSAKKSSTNRLSRATLEEASAEDSMAKRPGETSPVESEIAAFLRRQY
ncbi:hypothetical protein LJR030_003104 [Rhizobium sp. LjRoot30]|uniref:hypothetical protein n=1 Tax=Rhizobium sp. LjRoot30 TaxID=3342320 RepID=UPI003ECED1F8